MGAIAWENRMPHVTPGRLLVLVWAGSLLISSCSRSRRPRTIVQTASRYDSGMRKLSLECRTATTGACHFVLDDRGERRSLDLARGSIGTLANVDPAARLCALPAGGDPAGCAWNAVGQ